MFLGQSSRYVVGRFSRKILVIYTPNDYRLFFDDFHLTVLRAFLVAEKIRVRKAHLAVGESLALTPCGVFANAA
ncbi:hypothetical protein SDC9_99031 [bioreactor metagenome]|uniref:Uncharacterized protein n=1 Tax=bioreactor metagenome TaxID=1076179 RepID=A0A645AGD4_9ZZZZ